MLERLAHRLAGSVLIWDILLTLLCLRAASSLRIWLAIGRDLNIAQTRLPWPAYAAVAGIWLVILLLLTPQRALFTSGLMEAIGRLAAAIGLAALAFAGLLYLSYRDVSRLQFLYFAVSDLVVLLAYHLAVRSRFRLRQRHGWQHRVLLVGGGTLAQQLLQEFERRPWAGLQVVGCTEDDPHLDIGIPVLGPIDMTDRIVKSHRIDEVIFTLPPQQQETVVRLSLCIQQPVMLHMAPGLLDLAFARTPVSNLGGVPLISLRESALSESQWLLKRLFDMGASALLLIVLAPFMAIIALLIRIESRGPIFFYQERIGEHGRRFRMIKFRSMQADAEQHWQEVSWRDEQGQLLHKHNDDPRVTWLGRKLRRTSLDELPQLFNVLKGEMSLVGPRPEIPYIAAEYKPWQWQRLRVPPGMTGWWQVNGRSEKPMHLNTEDDLYYIQNYSFWLDLRILLMTVVAVLRGHGAY